MNALLALNTPRTFTAYSRSMSAPPVVTTVPTWPMPALLTRMSSAPWLASIRARERGERRFVGHVELDELRAALVDSRIASATRVAVGRVAIGHVHDRSRRRQRVGDGFANARPGAGHQRGLAVQSEHGD